MWRSKRWTLPPGNSQLQLLFNSGILTLHRIFKFGTKGLKVKTKVIMAKYMSELQDYNFWINVNLLFLPSISYLLL